LSGIQVNSEICLQTSDFIDSQGVNYMIRNTGCYSPSL
jgi:hypothetical protein